MSAENFLHQLPAEAWDLILTSLRYMDLVKACENPDFADFAAKQSFWKNAFISHFGDVEVGDHLKRAICYVDYHGLYMALSYAKLTAPDYFKLYNPHALPLLRLSATPPIEGQYVLCHCGTPQIINNNDCLTKEALHDLHSAEVRHILSDDIAITAIETTIIDGGEAPFSEDWPDQSARSVPWKMIDIWMKHPRWAGIFIHSLSSGKCFNSAYQRYPQMKKYFQLAATVRDDCEDLPIKNGEIISSMRVVEVRALVRCKYDDFDSYIEKDLCRILPKNYTV